jgi:hypothetical protein
MSPLTVQVLSEIGIPSEHLHSKNASEFLAKIPVTYAILLGHHDEAGAPRIYPFASKTLRWECVDPASEIEDERRLECVRQVRDSLDKQIREWVARMVARAA